MTSEGLPIFVLANDKVLQRYLMLCGSLRFFGYTNPVHILPYDDNLQLTTLVAGAMGHGIWQADYAGIDRFSRGLYDHDIPANPYPRVLGNLRKFAFLEYAGPAVYLDADIVLTAPQTLFDGVFGALGPSERAMAIGYINTSPTGVYEAVPEATDLLATSHLVCAGILAKGTGVVRIDAVEAHLTAERRALYTQVRRRGGHVDQPVWNYLVDTGLFEAVDLLAQGQASRVTSPEQRGVHFADDGAMFIGRHPILLLHMAGPLLKTSGGARFFWQGMLWEGLRHIRQGDAVLFQQVLDALPK